MSDVVSKWGREVAERGFVQIPNYLLNVNRFLDSEHRLTPVEILVLFQLVGNWWKKDENPYPSISTISVRCGVSSRQAQRAINNLDKMEFIKRIKRKNKGMVQSNEYDLTPLVGILVEISKIFPNEYPRKVTKEHRQLISQKLKPLIS